MQMRRKEKNGTGRQKLLFVYVVLSSFVEGDLKILRKAYDVTVYHYDNRRNSLCSVARQFFWLLFNFWRFDKVYVWFGDYHSFFPVVFARLFGKRVFLVNGGYDVCRIRKLKYGSFSNPVRGWIARYAMRHCTLNLSVSEYVWRKVRVITRKTNSVLLYNGVGISYAPVSPEEKRDVVLTVGLIDGRRRFEVKGIDRFLAVAEELPRYKFVIVGMDDGFRRELGALPGNVEVHGPVEQERLAPFYKEARVYCQLSRTDVFGMSVVEGMLYNCVPVVTNVGGLPEVVGDTGVVVSENRLDTLSGAIRRAMERPLSDRCHQRAEENFLLSVRERNLLNILRAYERI